MSASESLYDACAELDYRFATKISPDEETAAGIKEQDLCTGVVAGERCYFRLSDPNGQVCQREAGAVRVFGELAVGVLFEGIVDAQLNEGLDETPEA